MQLGWAAPSRNSGHSLPGKCKPHARAKSLTGNWQAKRRIYPGPTRGFCKMVDFSRELTSKGFFAPERYEGDIYDCEVAGSIPKDMNGAFIRVGGEWQYPSNYNDDSPFN